MSPTYLAGNYNQYWIYSYYSQIHRNTRQGKDENNKKRPIITRPQYVKAMRDLNRMILLEMIETGGYLKTETPIGNIQIIKYQTNSTDPVIDLYETAKKAKELRDQNITLKSQYNPDGEEFRVFTLREWFVYFFWSKYISSMGANKLTKYYKFNPFSPYSIGAKREWWYHLEEHIGVYEDYSHKYNFYNTDRYDSWL